MPCIHAPRRGPAAVVFTFLLLSTTASADYGRFLLSPDDSTRVFSYGGTGGNNMPTEFDQTVTCNGLTLGQVHFDYDTYLRKPNGNMLGGAVLAGGFYLDPNVMLNPGHHLGWVQTVDSTFVGDLNAWGIPAGTKNPGSVPDADSTNPQYPGQSVPTSPADLGPPTVPFQDFPSRRFAGGTQFWLAELGLVCFDDTPDGQGRIEGDVIFTFLWGFDVTVNPNGITATAPTALGPATQSYINTLDSYYSGHAPDPPTDGRSSTPYVFNNECDDCFSMRMAVPEPSSTFLVIVGAIGVGVHSLARRSRFAPPNEV